MHEVKGSRLDKISTSILALKNATCDDPVAQLPFKAKIVSFCEKQNKQKQKPKPKNQPNILKRLG